MELDTEELVVLYLYTKRRKRKRRVSVHELLQRRHEFGELFFFYFNNYDFWYVHFEAMLTYKKCQVIYGNCPETDISICGNDARKILADWKIAKKPRDLLKNSLCGQSRRSFARTKNCSRSHSIWTVLLQITKLFQDEKPRSRSV